MKYNKDEFRYCIKEVDLKHKKLDEGNMLTFDGVWAFLKNKRKKFK